MENLLCVGMICGPIEGLTNELAELRAQGVDYQIKYRFDLDRLFAANIGDFNVQLAGTYLIEREDQDFVGFPETSDRLDGELNFPEHFFNFALGWNKGR